MSNGWRRQREIWEGFDPKNVFEQRVCDAFQSLPCEHHDGKIQTLQKRHLLYILLAICGGIAIIIEALSAIKNLL